MRATLYTERNLWTYSEAISMYGEVDLTLDHCETVCTVGLLENPKNFLSHIFSTDPTSYDHRYPLILISLIIISSSFFSRTSSAL